MKAININDARIQLRKTIRKALKKHPKAVVIEALKHKRTNYQLLTMFSTTAGYGGAPNYEKLQICIKLLDEAIGELKNEEKL